jgi:hypothetical protein
VRPASAPKEVTQPTDLKTTLSTDEPKTSAFWPSDLASLLPGLPLDPKAASSSPAAASSRAANSAASESNVAELMRRLEQMGAVVMRLERQRGTPGGYLFRCELPMPHNPRYHRFFQAADVQPGRAVERVARDVEAWKATIR